MQHPPSKANNTSTMALTHILGLLTGFIGPLIIYLTTQDPEVKRHARLALNWQISWMIYFFISLLLVLVLVGILLLAILIVLDLVFCVMAAVKANDGIAWQYPLTISLIKD